MSAREFQDINTEVKFFTKRAKEPEKYDWGNIKRIMKYIKGTRILKLTLIIDDMSIIKW